MAQLEAMGFPQVRCQKALLATGNSDPEAAMNWLFAHMEDPGMFYVFSPPSSSVSDIDDCIALFYRYRRANRLRCCFSRRSR